VNVLFRKSFERDLKKIREQNVLAQVYKAIENVETASGLLAVHNLEKMSGSNG
jgi:hypothetical protein